MKIIFSLFILSFLRKLGLTKKELIITIHNEDGIFICGDKSIQGATSLYEKDLKKYFDLKAGIFVDVGANFGKYTVQIAKQLGKRGSVISIEPEKYTSELIKRNIEKNNLKNVFVVNKACSSKNGKSILWLEKTKYSGGTDIIDWR